MMVFFRHDDRWDYKRRVLLIRHPCDVMVSYWVHKTVRGKTKVPISNFIRHRRVGIPRFNKWYTRWSQREHDQLVVRYEDLFDTQTWATMLEFWYIPVYPMEFQQAIEKTQFDTIRENLEEIAEFPSAWRYLATMHGRYHVIDPKDPEAHKFRRGKVGGYVDYLGQDDIDYILGNFTLGESLEPYRQQYLLESEKYRA